MKYASSQLGVISANPWLLHALKYNLMAVDVGNSLHSYAVLLSACAVGVIGEASAVLQNHHHAGLYRCGENAALFRCGCQY